MSHHFSHHYDSPARGARNSTCTDGAFGDGDTHSAFGTSSFSPLAAAHFGRAADDEATIPFAVVCKKAATAPPDAFASFTAEDDDDEATVAVPFYTTVRTSNLNAAPSSGTSEAPNGLATGDPLLERTARCLHRDLATNDDSCNPPKSSQCDDDAAAFDEGRDGNADGAPPHHNNTCSEAPNASAVQLDAAETAAVPPPSSPLTSTASPLALTASGRRRMMAAHPLTTIKRRYAAFKRRRHSAAASATTTPQPAQTQEGNTDDAEEATPARMRGASEEGEEYENGDKRRSGHSLRGVTRQLDFSPPMPMPMPLPTQQPTDDVAAASIMLGSRTADLRCSRPWPHYTNNNTVAMDGMRGAERRNQQHALRSPHLLRTKPLLAETHPLLKATNPLSFCSASGSARPEEWSPAAAAADEAKEGLAALPFSPTIEEGRKNDQASSQGLVGASDATTASGYKSGRDELLSPITVPLAFTDAHGRRLVIRRRLTAAEVARAVLRDGNDLNDKTTCAAAAFPRADAPSSGSAASEEEASCSSQDQQDEENEGGLTAVSVAASSVDGAAALAAAADARRNHRRRAQDHLSEESAPLHTTEAALIAAAEGYFERQQRLGRHYERLLRSAAQPREAFLSSALPSLSSDNCEGEEVATTVLSLNDVEQCVPLALGGGKNDTCSAGPCECDAHAAAAVFAERRATDAAFLRPVDVDEHHSSASCGEDDTTTHISTLPHSERNGVLSAQTCEGKGSDADAAESVVRLGAQFSGFTLANGQMLFSGGGVMG